MNRQAIQLALLAAGVLCFVNLGATNYAVPTVAYLQGPLYDSFKARYWADGADTWSIRWACRDFTRAAACLASEENALTANAPEGTDAIAVLEVWFHPDASRGLNIPAGEGHAVVLSFTEQGIVGIDYQNGQRWDFSPTEFSSFYFVRG